jgi:hypothetical protein
MQPLSRVSTLGTVYSAQQVGAALIAPSREERWRFELLDSSGRLVDDISTFVDYAATPEISYDTGFAVKRQIHLRVHADVGINALKQLVRPHYQMLMADGGWIDWPLGTFTLTPPEKEIRPGASWWSLTGYDMSQQLVDAAFTSSYGVNAGTSYASAIAGVINSYGGSYQYQILIPDNGKTLPASIGWDAGQSRLQAVNDLLAAISYYSLWVGELGQLRSMPFSDLMTQLPSFTYDATRTGSVRVPMVERGDLSMVFNQFLVIVEDPRRESFNVYYENNNVDSPVSVRNWRPKMMPPIRDSRIVDAEAALARAKQEARQASRVYTPLTLDTLPWPLGQDNDVYGLVYKTNDEQLVNRSYSELSWTHRCKSGMSGTHEWLRNVAA